MARLAELVTRHFGPVRNRLRADHPGTGSCGPLPLEVYQVEDALLNDREVMSFLAWELWGNQDIYGVYDSASFEGGKGAIYIAGGVSRKLEEQIVIHELVHHQQDVHCLPLDEDEAYRIAEQVRHRHRAPGVVVPRGSSAAEDAERGTR